MPRDRVTEEVAQFVLRRDGGCVAALMGAPGACRDGYGRSVDRHHADMTLEHVQEGYGMMGKRAPSDPAHLVALCRFHGVQSWELANKDLLREYIAEVTTGVPATTAAQRATAKLRAN